MARRKQSDFEFFMELIALLPWWGGLLIAFISYLFMHHLATIEIPQAGDAAQMVAGVQKQIIKTVGIFGQILIPAVCIFGAMISFIKDCKSKKQNEFAYAKVNQHPDRENIKAYNRRHFEPVEISKNIEVPTQKDIQIRDDFVFQESVKKQEPPNYSWTVKFLQTIEWKVFEETCCNLLRAKGLAAEVTPSGPDKGIDINIYKQINNEKKLAGIAQCKAWNTFKVGVKEVRELFGVMVSEKVPNGFFFTSGVFTAEAKKFCEDKKIQLYDGERIIKVIYSLPDDEKKKLLEHVTKGDFQSPTCPKCNIKMMQRSSKQNRNFGEKFWGCSNFPRCKMTYKLRAN